MLRVDAEAIDSAYKFQSAVNISDVRFEWGRLAVTLVSGEDRKTVIVRFPCVVGFRLLDEGDLLDFWPTCSAENGWLFLIKGNGWFDLEATRQGFTREKGQGVLEYFVASQNSCLSVLSGEPPEVEVFSI
ncbi:hypothetical protein [Variovorax sp.]|jgi:hypothetical protein|uniref:hypothetical protein n=1 Tax=Variovorax sp. TaxID=1871043 RepID=UPI0025E27DE3|nr:hypothetical protein [Variovorax sp.]